MEELRLRLSRERSGSSPRATAASSACSTSRTSCSRSRRGRARRVPRGDERRRRRAVRPLARRGLDHDRRTTRSGSRRCGASKALVTIGACATAGGIQALRNFADVRDFVSAVYASPEYISTLETSTPICRARAGRLRAARLPDQQAAAARGRHAPSSTAAGPAIPSTSVCTECKRRGIVCVMVAHGTPCLGPVTHAGCGALCPAYDRGCYGCFGPMETPNTGALVPLLRASAAASSTSSASSGPSTRTPSRSARPSERVAERRTIRTDYLARVEGEGAMSVVLERRASSTSSCGSSSRRASSRRCSAAARSPRRPTSPRASAASARSPTRRAP